MMRDIYDEDLGNWSSEHDEFVPFPEDLSWIAQSGFSLGNTPPIGSKSVYVRVGSEPDRNKGRRSKKKKRRPVDAVDYRWYVVSPADLGPAPPSMPQPTILEPAFTEMPPDTPSHATVVALLPRIYILGGARRSSGGSRNLLVDAVYSYDISSPENGWERRPSMICARKSPTAVALNGKIYVFGGSVDWFCSDLSKTGPFAEVYDPKFDRWQGLSDSHGMIWDHFISPFYALFVDRCNKQHLLMHMVHYGCFTYNVSTGSITYWNTKFGYVEKAAVVDGILYCQNLGNSIYGYDLVNGKAICTPVHGLGEYLGDDDRKWLSLLDVGNGRLCLLWESEVFGVYDKGIIIGCLVVRVSRTLSLDTQEPKLQASVVSYREYIVPGNQLEDCLVL